MMKWVSTKVAQRRNQHRVLYECLHITIPSHPRTPIFNNSSSTTHLEISSSALSQLSNTLSRPPISLHTIPLHQPLLWVGTYSEAFAGKYRCKWLVFPSGMRYPSSTQLFSSEFHLTSLELTQAFIHGFAIFPAFMGHLNPIFLAPSGFFAEDASYKWYLWLSPVHCCPPGSNGLISSSNAWLLLDRSRHLPRKRWLKSLTKYYATKQCYSTSVTKILVPLTTMVQKCRPCYYFLDDQKEVKSQNAIVAHLGLLK